MIKIVILWVFHAEYQKIKRFFAVLKEELPDDKKDDEGPDKYDR